MVPSNPWYRRAVILTSCASWLFVSSCASQLPSGDQRRNSGVSGLTASEAQRAAVAAQIFSSGQLRRVGSVSDDVSVPPAAEQRLRTVAARYRGRDNLSPAEEAELVAAARPVVVPLAVQEARRQGESAYVIPARSIRTFTFPAYCLDRGIPAPKAGEPLQLVSAETLFPPKLLPLYQGLLRNAAQGRGRDNLTQGLVWNLRQFATGTDKTPITLSPDQEQAVAAADPNGPAIFADYAQQGFIQKLGEDAFNELLNQARSAAGFSRLPPAFTRLVNVSNKQALSNVEQSMRALLSQPSFGGSVGGDQGYTLLAPGLAAYATSVGRLDGVHVEVANTASGAAVLMPDGCTGDPGYKAQRVGIQTNAPSVRSPRSRVSIDFAPWDGGLPPISPAVFWREQDERSFVQPIASITQEAAGGIFAILVGLLVERGITSPTGQKAIREIVTTCRNSFNNDSIILNTAPTNADGTPAPPPVPPQAGKNGEANSWVPIAGSAGGRDTKWKPQYPVSSAAGGQPSASWDEPNGHWDVDDGSGNRTRYRPDGTPVDHDNNPI